MKDLSYLDKYRVSLNGHIGDETCGMFEIKLKCSSLTFRVIASSECGWHHVSVSTSNRCPKWNEMCEIKDMFFERDEMVIQYHMPENDNINLHQYCLHMWKPTEEKVPVPPSWMVGWK